MELKFVIRGFILVNKIKKSIYWIIGLFCILCIINCKKTNKPVLTPEVDELSQETEYSYVTVWGWSKDGKVAISEGLDTGETGWSITRAFIFDTITDKVLWEDNSDTEDLYGDTYDKAYTEFINVFQYICKHQYAIEIQKHNVRENNYPMIYGKSNDDNIYRYYINIDVVPRHSGSLFNTSFWDTMESYSISVTAGNGKKKTIYSRKRKDNNDPLYYERIDLYGCVYSPNEEIVLIIIKGEYNYMDGGFGLIFTGCNLNVGF